MPHVQINTSVRRPGFVLFAFFVSSIQTGLRDSFEISGTATRLTVNVAVLDDQNLWSGGGEQLMSVRNKRRSEGAELEINKLRIPPRRYQTTRHDAQTKCRMTTL